jgi:hypothetical protein
VFGDQAPAGGSTPTVFLQHMLSDDEHDENDELEIELLLELNEQLHEQLHELLLLEKDELLELSSGIKSNEILYSTFLSADSNVPGRMFNEM